MVGPGSPGSGAIVWCRSGAYGRFDLVACRAVSSRTGSSHGRSHGWFVRCTQAPLYWLRRRQEKGQSDIPAINVKVIEGVFSDAQKGEMIEKLTDAMVSVEGESMRPVTWVIVEEVKSGDWGIGGKQLSTADVKALAAGH